MEGKIITTVKTQHFLSGTKDDGNYKPSAAESWFDNDQQSIFAAYANVTNNMSVIDDDEEFHSILGI